MFKRHFHQTQYYPGMCSNEINDDKQTPFGSFPGITSPQQQQQQQQPINQTKNPASSLQLASAPGRVRSNTNSHALTVYNSL